MRFFLIFLLLIPSVSGGIFPDAHSFTDRSTGILKKENPKNSQEVRRKVTFSEEKEIHIFEVRRYIKSWDWILYLIEDTEEKIPSYFKGVFFAAVGVFSLQHMLYNPTWGGQLLAGRSCYVFTKRLYALVGKRLQKGAEPSK